MRPWSWYDLRCVGVDPFMSRTLVSRLTSPVNDAGGEKPCVRCIDIPQDIRRMSPPTKELERLIRGHKMLHIHNTCARWVLWQCPVLCGRQRKPEAHEGPQHRPHRHCGGVGDFPGYSHHHAGAEGL